MSTSTLTRVPQYSTRPASLPADTDWRPVSLLGSDQQLDAAVALYWARRMARQACADRHPAAAAAERASRAARAASWA